MWIGRDINQYLKDSTSNLVQVLIGPRQCGKSSLFWMLGKDSFHEVTFDDFQMRSLAKRDPAFFLEQQKLPLIIDEVQYVPEIFSEIKILIDKVKRKRLTDPSLELEVLFRLTGSSQILIDKEIKESLAGRASFYFLNTLSVSEINRALPEIKIGEILFKGGYPEIYISNLSPGNFLNDYIRTYIEKDIVLDSGIIKQKEFRTILGMLAARVGEFLNYSNIAQNSGVKSVTVKEWVSVLERSNLLYLLMPTESNLNKRLTKAPKVYFLDSGLTCRLQGWSSSEQMLLSPQAGHIFENLVLGEIVKCINNFGKDWEISVWRTKDGEEVDFVIKKENGDVIALDAKMGLHSVQPEKLPNSFRKSFPEVDQLVLITYGGERLKLSKECIQVPIKDLVTFLIT